MQTMRRQLQLLAAIVAMLFASQALFSQGSAGRILGTVSDQTGGAVVGATVSITDVQRGVSRNLITDQSGEYNAPNLLPGTYAVRVEAKGFRGIERQNIILEVNQDARVDFQVQPGEVTQTITVTEALPLVETTNAELGGTLQNQIIEGLPLNGRNFEKLLDLRPGVAIYAGAPTYSQSTNGLRPHYNTYLFEGINSTDPWMAQAIVTANMTAGDAGTLISIDAIDEFKLEENPRAEYGWKPGAVVNVGVKSGTNSYHGTAFAYGRDGSWDARNYFNQPPGPVPPVALEQFGATLGGPIKKDKLFYFLAFEDQRYTVGSIVPFSTPITAAGVFDPGQGAALSNLLAGCQAALDVGAPGSGKPGALATLSAQLAGIQVGPVAAGHPNGTCQQAANYPGLFPVNPGNNASGQGVTFVNGSGLVTTNQIDTGLAKVDYHLTDKHALNFMYMISPGNGNFLDNIIETNPVWRTNQYARSQIFASNWTWTPSSSWVNEVRVGYSHYYQNFLSLDHSQDPANYSFNGSTYHFYNGQTNPAYFGFPGLSDASFTGALGAGWPKTVGPDAVLHLLDHVSYLRGKHAFKFGGEVLVDRSTTNVTSNAKGPIQFDDLPDFFTGFPNGPCKVAGGPGNSFAGGCPGGATANILIGNLVRHVGYQGYGVFFQDDWRFSPRLTLNLGLRYELNTVPKERNNLLGNFAPGTPSGLAQVGAGESSIYNGDHNNFAPRLGVAWDIFGNGKTVLRAGGGILYEQFSLDTLVGVGQQFGLRTTPTGVALYKNCAGGVANASCHVPSPGTMSVLNVAYAGTPVINNYAPGDIPFQWVNNSPTNTILSFVPACGDGTGALPTGFVPQPCNVMFADPRLRSPYVENWNVDIQRAITNNVSVSIGYVGNHGTKLLGALDVNQPVANTANVAGVGLTTFGPGYTAAGLATCASNPTRGNCAPSGALEQAARPYNTQYPYLRFIDEYGNFDTSSYNGLQATVTARNYHGFTSTIGYTFSHALGEHSDEASVNGLLIPINTYGNYKQQLWGPTTFDMRHHFTISESYTLPGRKGFGQMLEGWSIDSTAIIETGTPWGINDSTTDFAGTGEQTGNTQGNEGSQWSFFGNYHDFAAINDFHGVTPGPTGAPGVPYFPGTTNANCLSAAQAGGPLQVASLTVLGCYAMGGSVLIPPTYGGYGSMSRNPWRDGGYRNWDLSIGKVFNLTERFKAQFRADIFNILNHTNYVNPYGIVSPTPNLNPSRPGNPGLGFVSATPDQAASDPVLGSGGARDIQLGLKLIF